MHQSKEYGFIAQRTYIYCFSTNSMYRHIYAYVFDAQVWSSSFIFLSLFLNFFQNMQFVFKFWTPVKNALRRMHFHETGLISWLEWINFSFITFKASVPSNILHLPNKGRINLQYRLMWEKFHTYFDTCDLIYRKRQ